jgi:rubrerythrin
MPFYFAPFEITKMAVEIEDAGAIFYHSLAEKTADGTLKNIFLDLELQEKEHGKIFTEMMNEERDKNGTAEFMADINLMMKTDVDDLKRITFNLRKVQASIADLHQAIDIGIKAEEDSIAVYSQMQNEFIEKFHSVLQRIIDQERGHLERLRKIKNEMFL